MQNSAHFRDFYDCIVLSDHLAALACGGLLSQRGLSILVLPVSNTSNESIRMGEWRSLFGVGSHTFSGMLRGMGIEEDLSHWLKPAISQVVTPRTRLSYLSDEALEAELFRELGKDAEGLGLVRAIQLTQKAFRTETATIGTIDRWRGRFRKTAKTILAQQPKTVKRWLSHRRLPFELLQEALSVTLKESAGSHRSKKTSFFGALCQIHWLQSGFFFQGEQMTEVRDRFLDQLVRLGTQVIREASCGKVIFEKNRFVGVQVGNSKKRIAASHLILGCPFVDLLPLIDKDRLSFLSISGLQRKKRFDPLCQELALSLEAPSSDIQAGVQDRVRFLSRSGRLINIELARSDSTDRVRCVAAEEMSYLRTGHLESSKAFPYQKIQKALAEIFPFADRYFRVVHHHTPRRVFNGADRPLVFPRNVFFAGDDSAADLADSDQFYVTVRRILRGVK